MKLLEFPHSHYCEAARWALDLKGVKYEREALLPGLHMLKVGRIAPQSSVPVLIDNDKIVQGSREIIDYCDANFDGPRLMPEDAGAGQAIDEIEAKADKNIGIPLRAIIYNWLLEDRKSVEHCFMQNSGSLERIMFRAMYPVTKRIIRKTYIPSQEYIAKAKVRFEEEITRLDAMIEGREFLVADRLSRADIMVASMLSISVLPDEHSCDWPVVTDHNLSAFRDQYLDRPAFKWAQKMYAQHRH